MYWGTPSVTNFGAAMAGMGGAAQGRHLGNMMGMTMGAINQENQSRVAQMREARRQQHEKDLMLMRLQGMNQQRPRGRAEPSPEMLAALEVLRMENEAGRSGTVKNRALKMLGLS